jgi:hypothetical protein
MDFDRDEFASADVMSWAFFIDPVWSCVFVPFLFGTLFPSILSCKEQLEMLIAANHYGTSGGNTSNSRDNAWNNKWMNDLKSTKFAKNIFFLFTCEQCGDALCPDQFTANCEYSSPSIANTILGRSICSLCTLTVQLLGLNLSKCYLLVCFHNIRWQSQNWRYCA